MTERADHCDCEDRIPRFPERWTCGKRECHRTLIANALIKAAVRQLQLHRPRSSEDRADAS